MQIISDSATKLCTLFSGHATLQGQAKFSGEFANNDMTHASYEHLQATRNRGGGRISSDQFRYSQNLSNAFLGLEEGTNRYDLLLLVKRVGKQAGFTPRMIQLLDYYMAYTAAIDWEEGSRPIVFQSLARTALDLGVTERQIQTLEKRLFEVGAITWNDSGNHKRYGHRDRQTGRLVYAYGIELTPLAYLKQELEAKLLEKQLYAKAWQETKREISAIRRQLRSLLLEWQADETDLRQTKKFEQAYQEIAKPIRTHMTLHSTRELLKRHKALLMSLLKAMRVKEPTCRVGAITDEMTENSACTAEDKFAHKEQTNPVKKLNNASKLEKLNLPQLIRCAGQRFRKHLPIEQKFLSWNDFIEAADRTRRDLQISQSSWAEACGAIGRERAAACVLLTDKGSERSKNPVTRLAAYFRGMIRKVRTGHLSLSEEIVDLKCAEQRKSDPLNADEFNASGEKPRQSNSLQKKLVLNSNVMQCSLAKEEACTDLPAGQLTKGSGRRLWKNSQACVMLGLQARSVTKQHKRSRSEFDLKSNLLRLKS